MGWLVPRDIYPRSTFRVATRMMARSLLWAFGFLWIEEFDKKNFDDQSCIIVTNHPSIWEILYLLSLHDPPTFVFKAGCMNVPFAGKVAKYVLQGIEVDNTKSGSGSTSAILDRIHKMRASEDRISTYRSLVIFAEGTTSNGSCILSFKRGAFLAGERIQPIVFQ